MQRITVSMGKLNLPKQLVKLSAFIMDDRFIKTSAYREGGTNTKSWTSSTRHPDIGGRFMDCTVEHADGTVIMVMANMTRNGVLLAEGVKLLRLRAAGPMLHISAKLPIHHESLLGERYTAFTGCADLLTAEQAKAIGMPIPNNFVSRFMNEEEVEELYEVNELRPASQPAPVYVTTVTSQGTVSRAVAPEPVRRVRLRRS